MVGKVRVADVADAFDDNNVSEVSATDFIKAKMKKRGLILSIAQQRMSE
jgi:hypothetical protein